MNGNDLMNALNGIDPKYIDEAAFELHEKKASKTVPFRRIMYVALPAAAALLLTATVLLSGLVRHNKNSASETAAPVFDGAAADEAPAAAAEAPAYEEEDFNEEAEAADEAPAAAEAPAYEDEALNIKDDSTYSFAPAAESEQLKTRGSALIGLEKADFENGILTVSTTGTIPENIGDLEYVITEGDGTSGKTISEGILADIIQTTDPLTLDLSKLEPAPGEYTLTIADESISFTVE